MKLLAAILVLVAAVVGIAYALSRVLSQKYPRLNAAAVYQIILVGVVACWISHVMILRNDVTFPGGLFPQRASIEGAPGPCKLLAKYYEEEHQKRFREELAEIDALPKKEQIRRLSALRAEDCSEHRSEVAERLDDLVREYMKEVGPGSR